MQTEPGAIAAGQELRHWTRGFVERVILPVARDLDRLETAERFSWDIVEKASAYGIKVCLLSEVFRGAALRPPLPAVVIEELARGDLGVATTLGQSMQGAQLLEKFGKEQLRNRCLAAYAQDPRALFAVAVDASDQAVPGPDVPAGLMATRISGGWSVTGTKRRVVNGSRARYAIVFAKRADAPSSGALCFLLERDRQGVVAGAAHDTLGERLADRADLEFSECSVPDDAVLGADSTGGDILAECLAVRNVHLAASAVGVALSAYEGTVAWARKRVQGGAALIEHDSVLMSLAEMRLQIDAARAYTHSASVSLEAPRSGDPTPPTLPRVFATKAAWRVAVAALELHGGWGYMREFPIEKLVRDAGTLLVADRPERHFLLEAGRVIRGP